MNEQNASIPSGQGIPNSPTVSEDSNGEIGGLSLAGAIDAQVVNGKSEAEKQCSGKKCCATVTVTVSCDSSIVKYDEIGPVGGGGRGTTGGKPKCGKTATYDCKTKQWTGDKEIYE